LPRNWRCQEVRKAREPTQKKLAKPLRIGQEGVSKIEMRSDLLISILRSYVEAVGGRLSLVAEFPDQEPVVLSGFSESTPSAKHGKRQTHAVAWGGLGSEVTNSASG
jgi:hypothetical protein